MACFTEIYNPEMSDNWSDVPVPKASVDVEKVPLFQRMSVKLSQHKLSAVRVKGERPVTYLTVTRINYRCMRGVPITG